MPKVNISSYRDIASRWFRMSQLEQQQAGLPTTLKDFGKYIGVGSKTMRELKRLYYDTKVKGAITSAKLILEEEDYDDYDSDTWLKSRTQEADKALIKSCATGNAQALRLFNQLINRLVEKQEVTHKLDGQYLAREIIRVRRELESERMAEMSALSQALPPDLCVSSGQE